MNAFDEQYGGAQFFTPPDDRNKLKPTPVVIKATSFVWRDPAEIPIRPWVYGRWLLRNTITAVVAPGGVGKSSFMASTALALATGRSLLGKPVWDGPKRAWYWNLEDDGEELSRQIQAAAIQHGVNQDDCGDRLFVDSGLDGAGLCTAVEGPAGFVICEPVIEALVKELVERAIDVLIVDPFVSSHTVSENDNGAIDAVAKEWARVAKRAHCSIVLVHHTKKLAGQKVTSEMSRGATALINAARAAIVLNRMDAEEAARFGIEGDDERRRYFSVQDDKHNRAPAENANWYRMVSVDLGNGGDGAGDNIGVVTSWAPTDAFDGISGDHLYKVQVEISRGQWRESHQSPQWVGVAVAKALGLDMAARTTKRRVLQLLKQWITNGALIEVEGKDKARKTVRFIEVGHWQNDASAPPAQVERSEVEQSRAPTCSTTTPLGVEGWSGAERDRTSRVEQDSEQLRIESDLFMACLDASYVARHNVSHRVGADYAPTIFAKMPEAMGMPKDVAERAMHRLRALGAIQFDQPLWIGANRHPKHGIARTPHKPEVAVQVEGSQAEAYPDGHDEDDYLEAADE